MHTTSTRLMVDQLPVAKAALAAVIFTAGVAVGAVIGTTSAPGTAPAPASVRALDPDAKGFWLHRDGEIGLGAAPAESGLREQRRGEINAGAAPANSERHVDTSRHLGLGGP